MKQFFKKIVLFSIVPLILFVAAFFVADGGTDEFYVRFTTPQQNSMIVGTSRAAQGIIPSVIDSVLNNNNTAAKLFNYSFTIAHSPYGPAYYESIKRKLNENARGGKFIVAVDPWSLSIGKETPDEGSKLPENDLAVGQTKDVTSSPNFDYLTNAYQYSPMMIWMEKLLKVLHLEGVESLYLHDNGWLEVTVGMDSADVEKRIARTIKKYESDRSLNNRLSAVRFDYLHKTIELLRSHGDVLLVRLPVHPRIKSMEDKFCPQFDSLMNNVSKDNAVPYLNFMPENTAYQYTDGSHMYKDSGKRLSKKIAEFIITPGKK